MKFNYFAQKRRFDETWEELAKTYAEAGMEPDAIQQMYDFDWSVLCKHRVEAMHEAEIDVEEREMIMEQVTVDYDIYGGHSRYWWLEELSSPCLTMGIPLLKEEDKELLTLYIYEQRTIREIAQVLGKSRSSVSERLQRIFSLFPTSP